MGKLILFAGGIGITERPEQNINEIYDSIHTEKDLKEFIESLVFGVETYPVNFSLSIGEWKGNYCHEYKRKILEHKETISVKEYYNYCYGGSNIKLLNGVTVAEGALYNKEGKQLYYSDEIEVIIKEQIVKG